MDKMLVEHVVKPHVAFAKKNGKLIPIERKQVGRIGTFVGINDSGRVRVGWSTVAFHSGDKFNADAGIAFATVKALNPEEIPAKVEKKYGLRKDFQILKKRCSKFFKGIAVEGYDPSLDALAMKEEDNEKEHALRESLRNVLPEGSKHLADGPIMGLGDGMSVPLKFGNAEEEILKLMGTITSLMPTEYVDRVEKAIKRTKKNPCNCGSGMGDSCDCQK